MRIRLLLIALFAQWQLLCAHGGGLDANLSSATAEVGDEVQLEIRASDLKNPQPPEGITIEGLEISYQGQQHQQQVRIDNGTLTSSSSVVFTYSVVPKRAGLFEIPPVTVATDKGPLKTQILRLQVGGGAQGENNNRLAFAEIVVPKESAYVGEAIPVELRFYVDTRVRGHVEQMPSFAAEGYTTQKLGKPLQNQVERDGKLYDLLTFKTAITPVKTGKLVVGPVEMQCLAQLPQKRRRTNPGFGGLQDLLSDDFFANQLQPVRRVSIRSEPLGLEIKPLPPGAPEGFAGAVGQFELGVQASPLALKTGDPITLKMKVHGRGNLDRVTAPVLGNSDGWKTYPPSNRIEPDDDLGISGTKTFEMAVIPEELKTETPELRFVYFDPVAESYKVLSPERLALTVSPSATASLAPSTPTAKAAPVSQPEAATILHILDTDPGGRGSFVPLFMRKEFWLWQIAPASILMLLIGHTVWRSRQIANGGRSAQFQSAKQNAMRQLRVPSIPREDFYKAASDYLRLVAFGSTDGQALMDCAAVCGSRVLEAQIRRQVEEIFEQCESLRYSGGNTVGEPVSEPEMNGVLETLKAYEKANV